MRENGTLYWLFTDHLGSTAITAYSGGGKKAKLRYKAWGETRYSYGTTPTAYKFTGQRWDETIGLYFYKARYYDPALGRFVQADTVVPAPGNPQALNRYSYVYNNPVRYTDPSGRSVFEHTPDDPLFTPPRWPYPAMRSVSEPPEPPVLGPALEILAQTPTGQPIVQFAMAHEIHVWFGVGPFDTPFGSGIAPRGTWIILPRALRSHSVMRQPGNVFLIAHELIHAMQNTVRGNQVPYSLYREVEAYMVQEVLAWEIAPSVSSPRTAQQVQAQAQENLRTLSSNLATAYAEIEAQYFPYRTPLFYKEPAGDPAVTAGQLLNRPDFPAYIHDIIYGPQYGGLLAMVVQYLK